jgi:hypothetical protein
MLNRVPNGPRGRYLAVYPGRLAGGRLAGGYARSTAGRHSLGVPLSSKKSR